MRKMKRGIAQITDATIAYGFISLILVLLLIPLSMWAQEEYQLSVAAGQANTVQKAVNRYIADFQSTIASNNSPSTAYTLTVPMLVSANYLPSGYSSKNAYTATYQTLIFQPMANKFHSMTFMSGGTPLTMSQARRLANYIGASGGYIENGIAKGALGSWQENLTAFGGYNPGDGTVVIAGFYANGALVNDYLYRHSVAGHPELNTMGTSLNMGGNDINAGNSLNANNGNFSQTVNSQTLNAASDVNTARLTAQQSVQSNGWISANGNIVSNSNISAAGSITSNSTISAAGNITSNGQIWSAGTITSYGDVVADGNLRSSHDAVLGGILKLGQVNNVGTWCDTWGAISRDPSGAILSCQSGVWTSPSSGAYDLSQNGFKILDSSTGLMMQWGFTQAKGDNQTACFPRPFNRTVLFVNVESVGRQIHGDNGHDYVGNINNSCFTFTSEPGSAGTSFFSVGY